jgi:MoaD family protein
VIKVKLYSIFKNIIGKEELTLNVDAISLKEVIDHIFSEYSNRFKEIKYYVNRNGYPSNIAVYAHGKMLRLNEETLQMELKDGDIIHLLEIVAGG